MGNNVRIQAPRDWTAVMPATAGHCITSSTSQISAGPGTGRGGGGDGQPTGRAPYGPLHLTPQKTSTWT